MRLGAKIGEGSEGTIYETEYAQQPAAVKLDKIGGSRMFDEYRMLQRSNNTHVI